MSLVGVPAIAPSDLPAGWAKLLLIAIILLSETLPRGGELQLKVEGDGSEARFVLAAEGSQIVFADDQKALLGGDAGAVLDARNVLAYLTQALAARQKQKIDVRLANPGRLEFSLI